MTSPGDWRMIASITGLRMGREGAAALCYGRGDEVKQHKFWAGAMIFCMVMLVYTGKKHK